MIKCSGEPGVCVWGSMCKILRTMYRSGRMPEQLTDNALCAKGLAVLEDPLGPVHTLPFLALMSRESFDYQRYSSLPSHRRVRPDRPCPIQAASAARLRDYPRTLVSLPAL